MLFIKNSTDFEPIRKDVIYGEIAILSVVAVIVMLSIALQFGATSKCGQCRNCMDLVVAMLVFTVWTLCAVQFALSVQLSDGCDDPQRSVLEIVNVTQSADAATMEIMAYYLECDAVNESNPLLNDTQSALRSLESMNATIYEALSVATDCGIETETDILFEDYNRTLYQLHAVEQVLSFEMKTMCFVVMVSIDTDTH